MDLKKQLDKSKIDDSVFLYNEKEQQEMREKAPWKSDNHYFKNVKLSAICLLKMVMHAHSGCRFKDKNLEVMGLLTGKIEGDTFVVLDSFAVTEGNEYQVNTGGREIEFIASYMDHNNQLNRKELVVGWYHSHPGYSCYLSGTDVGTQRQNQQFQDPWLAIVVDPVATVSSGKVEVGAFRTYPQGYKPPESSYNDEYQHVPEDKIEEFGVNYEAYYKLPIELFKSTTDEKLLNKLWNKYWVKTFSSSPLLANKDFISKQCSDVGKKMRKCDHELGKKYGYHSHFHEEKKKEKSELQKVNMDNNKVTSEAMNGLMFLELKKALFGVKL